MPTHAEFMITYLDHSNDISSVSFPGVTLTAANFVTETAAQDAINTALGPFTNGYVLKVERKNVSNQDRQTPSSEECQVEKKWLLRYKDDTTFKIHTLHVPTADLTGNLMARNAGETGPERVDLTDTNGAALKTAFEAYVKAGDSYDHEVTLLDMLYV